MFGHPPLYIETSKKRTRRSKKLKRFVVDICRVIDCKEFDLDALQNAFRSMQIVVDKSEMVVKTKLSKTQVMMRLDKVLAKTIRLFEMDSHFCLCEPLVDKKRDHKEMKTSRPSTPAASPPPTRRRAHLVPPSSGTVRHWSGAAGSDKKPQPFRKPFSAWPPMQQEQPQRAPQIILQAKPKSTPRPRPRPAAPREAPPVEDLTDIVLTPRSTERGRLADDLSEDGHAWRVAGWLRSDRSASELEAANNVHDPTKFVRICPDVSWRSS